MISLYTISCISVAFLLHFFASSSSFYLLCLESAFLHIEVSVHILMS